MKQNFCSKKNHRGHRTPQTYIFSIRKWEIPDKYIPEVVNNGVKTEFQEVLDCDFQAQPMPAFSSGI